MKVGDLVRFKHDHKSVGLITDVDPNLHDSVTYKVQIIMPKHLDEEKVIYSYQLEVINETR